MQLVTQPITDPAYISSKKCWDKYTLEYAIRSAVKKQVAFTVLLLVKNMSDVNRAKAMVVCPDGKLLKL